MKLEPVILPLEMPASKVYKDPLGNMELGKIIPQNRFVLFARRRGARGGDARGETDERPDRLFLGRDQIVRTGPGEKPARKDRDIPHDPIPIGDLEGEIRNVPQEFLHDTGKKMD
ncbi:MAG: hypothetical protein EBX52_08630 [Proteobacteria bacterium]|nr:hypothetical protein [Pseudomonadota bacterium]